MAFSILFQSAYYSNNLREGTPMFLQILSHFGIHVTLCCWLSVPDVSKGRIAFLLLVKDSTYFIKNRSHIFEKQQTIVVICGEIFNPYFWSISVRTLFKYYIQFFYFFFVNPSTVFFKFCHPVGINVQTQK